MKKLGHCSLIASFSLMIILLSSLRVNALNIPDVERYVLDNKMTFLLVPRKSSSISFEVRVKVGSLDEGAGKAGLSHLLEHMMFKGTDNIGTTDYAKEKSLLRQMNDIAARINQAEDEEREKLEARLKELVNEASLLQVPGELDRIYSLAGGVDLNASTSADLTSYHVTLPSDRIELWASIESRRMTNPVFREFYSERDVVLKELSQRVDLSDQGALYEKFLLHAFDVSPYRIPVIGFRKDIERLTGSDLEEYYFRHYVPSNMVVAIVGGFSSKDIKPLLKRYFGKIPAGKVERHPLREEPSRRAQVRVKVPSKEQPVIMIGVIKPRLPDIDDTCFDVIENVLSGGETSRLVKALVKKGLASGVDTYNGIPGSRLDNLFVISASPIKPVANNQIEEVIWDEIEQLKTSGVTEEEIARSVRAIKKSVLSSMLTDAGAASVLSLYEAIAGDWMYIYDNLAVLESLKPEQIKECAQRYLVRQHATTAVMEE